MPSNWPRFFEELHGSLSGRYDDRRSGGIIAFLGECFTGDELISIAHSAFSNRDLAFREVCFSQGVSVKDANAFLAGRTKQEVMQLLLLMRDLEIVSSVDKYALSGKLKVPSGEVRVPRLNHYTTGAFDTRLECTSLGARVVSSNARVSMQRLHRLVSEVYEQPELKKRLDWKIRNLEGDTFEQKLRHYLSTEDVRKVISGLFLTGPDVFEAAASKLSLSFTGEEEDHALAERMSWKLGFPNVTHDVGVTGLRSRVQDMREVTPRATPSREDEERVRGSSVHLFVELEKSLDSALCFSTWLTEFDHWAAHPRFTYSHAEARRFMAATLTERARKTGKDISYDPAGVNTLFPLIMGFGLLASHLEEISDTRHEFLRPTEDTPSMFRSSTLVEFGYPYKMPFLNFSAESMEVILTQFRSIARVLSEGKVLNVRNSLEHHREEFPDCADVLTSLVAIEKYCDVVEECGLIPITFRMVGHSSDSFGRARYHYEDGGGRSVSVPTYSPVLLTGQPKFSKDQILVPGVRIANSDLTPRFSLGVSSPYVEMWSDWPRNRSVGLLKESLEVDSDRESLDISSSESA